jgi:uncharacterized delta-60 repeat protein
LVPPASLAQAGAFDSTFNAQATVGHSGLSVAVQSDGRILAAGTFGLLRLLNDGSVDPSFNAPFPTGQIVNAIALQPNGKVIVAAGLTNAHGTPLPGLMRLESDGSVDPTFNLTPGVHPYGGTIGLQADGRILASGVRVFETGIFRLLPDGSLDPSFNAGWLNSSDFLSAIAISPEGTIYFALEGFTFGIASVNPDGSLNGLFEPESGLGPWGALALQPDRKIIVGQGADGAGPPFTPLRRLLPNGEDDPDWLSTRMDGGDCEVRSIVVQPDGKIVVGGNNIMSINGVPVPSLGRLNADGTVDLTFDAGNGAALPAHYYSVDAMALAPDGKIIGAGWHVALPNYTPAQGIWRLNAVAVARGIEFTSQTYVATEGDRIANVTVRRTGDTTHRASVHYHLEPGTATRGVDYTGSGGVLQFRAGEATKTFLIRAKEDNQTEGIETVRLFLNRATGAEVGPQNTATLTILDN